jgi:hypothetical protein
MAAVMLMAALASCAAMRADRSAFTSAESSDRAKAILSAGERNDRVAIPLIIDRLDDDDVAVRSIAIQTLHRMTGQDFGYRTFDNVDERSKAVQRWRAWLKDSRIDADRHPSTQQAERRDRVGEFRS